MPKSRDASISRLNLEPKGTPEGHRNEGCLLATVSRGGDRTRPSLLKQTGPCNTTNDHHKLQKENLVVFYAVVYNPRASVDYS